jgi:hypothetical protein
LLDERKLSHAMTRTLQSIQAELQMLWKDDRYSDAFKFARLPQKDFGHALLHILKAAGKLAVMVEEADHASGIEVIKCFLPDKQAEKYLADIVISAMRMANTIPTGVFSLEQAVLERIKEKMGVDQ